VFVRLENALVEVFLMQQNLSNFSEFDTLTKRCEILPPSYRSTTSRLGLTLVAVAIASFASIAGIAPASASSHMDAPLITLEPAANTTDVYAFVSQNPKNGQQYLTTAVAVYPFEEPGIGPNLFRFDDRVVYDIHVALGNDIAKGKSDLTYRFQFKTEYANTKTILSYLGEVVPKGKGEFPDNQNLRQTYSVTVIDDRHPEESFYLGSGIVPPNNQGLVTPFYNQNNDGDQPAKGGVAKGHDLDPYTANAIADLWGGFEAFAGQRDDGFYADVQSIFDLDFSFGRTTKTPTKPFDSQGGFNVHTIVLNIPLSQLSGAKMAGVYATTSHWDADHDQLIQVGRQGNPLFCEIFIAEVDKDRYNETPPTLDAKLFTKYAANPEASAALSVTPIIPGLLQSIFIPDLIKVDLTTGPARLAGSPGFNRLGVFGGDVLHSTVQDPFGNGGFIPGGWPNGRRFGDDVANIGLIAVGAAGPFGSIDPNFNVTRVEHNDETYNTVFPYAATPHNGRNIAPPKPSDY
jgi:hypothetical protein